MKEVISIHVGQTGIQVGNACWELYCLDHNISPDGTLAKPEMKAGVSTKTTVDNAPPSIFFDETANGKQIPRAVFLDLEPSVVDEIRTGTYRRLFHPGQLYTGKEDAGQNYARGHLIGKEMIDMCMERIRSVAGSCEDLEGFLLFHSVGGGAGSGLTSLLAERLSVEYGKKSKMAYSVYPSPQTSTAIVDPYNAVLATHNLVEHADAVNVMDNEALHSCCRRQLDIRRPSLSNLNELISQVVAQATLPLRVQGKRGGGEATTGAIGVKPPSELNSSLAEMQANWVPFPKLHFLVNSLAPIQPDEQLSPQSPLSTFDMSHSLFSPSHSMVAFDPLQGHYLAATIIYRGDVVPKDVSAACGSYMAKTPSSGGPRFVDYAPFRMSTPTHRAPLVRPGGIFKRLQRSALLTANSTEMGPFLDRLGCKFDLLYSKRAFVHWFLKEGMEETEFTIAREDVAAVVQDYKEVEQQANEKREHATSSADKP